MTSTASIFTVQYMNDVSNGIFTLLTQCKCRNPIDSGLIHLDMPSPFQNARLQLRLSLVRPHPSLLFPELFLAGLSSPSPLLRFLIFVPFSISFWFLILLFCFHFTFRAIAESFFLSVSILFHNAPLNCISWCASDSSAASAPSHLNCDILGQWISRH
jgi:hypothetical protein